jgi:hypothetical protein
VLVNVGSHLALDNSMFVYRIYEVYSLGLIFTWSKTEPLARQALDERGRALPDKEGAVRAVANGIPLQDVADTAVPEKAARKLDDLARHVNGRPARDDLWPFAGLWASLDAAMRDLASWSRAGDPGIEPGVAVLETTVLPIHQSPGGPDCRG